VKAEQNGFQRNS